ncbi:hypothetical protein AGMMS49975_25060 [Clostridia bacterium]|nr:hypothetical protein AGMMS49975_25060 [Clostridia bacterium]
MRELVTVQEVVGITPIEGADAIELAHVLGWQCVVKKGEFNSGDIGVFYEVDSYLPVEERYDFLMKSSYRNNAFMGEGIRIKTMRMRGQISQGLFLPIEIVPEARGLAVGTDLTELLGVRKWELPEVSAGSMGAMRGDKPHGIPTTDETRMQTSPRVLRALSGRPYYITTKMDGTSCTVYHKDGEVGVCSRNFELKNDGESSYWDIANSYDLPNKLRDYGKNIAVQGEFCGEGIQKNRIRLSTPKLYVFSVVDLDTHEYWDYAEVVALTNALGLDMVPIEEVGNSFNLSSEELLVKAQGKYPGGNDKEGIVIRSQAQRNSRVSFKVLNNKALLKED